MVTGRFITLREALATLAKYPEDMAITSLTNGQHVILQFDIPSTETPLTKQAMLAHEVQGCTCNPETGHDASCSAINWDTVFLPEGDEHWLHGLGCKWEDNSK